MDTTVLLIETKKLFSSSLLTKYIPLLDFKDL